MSARELSGKEVSALPEQPQQEVYDFVRFLKLKGGDEAFNGLTLNQAALDKEWNTPEEDVAWTSL